MKIRQMITRFCAIALLGTLPIQGCLILGIGVLSMAPPAQAATPTPILSSVDSYRRNLSRLRSHSSLDNGVIAPSFSASDRSGNYLIEETATEETVTEATATEETVIEGTAIEGTATKETAEDKKAYAQSKKRLFLPASISLKNIQKKFQLSGSQKRSDPYVIIAAAKNHSHSQKGESFIRSYSIPPLPKVSVTNTQAELRKRALLAREKLPVIANSPQTAVKRKMEEMTDFVRAAVVKALSWTEQTAHTAAENVKAR